MTKECTEYENPVLENYECEGQLTLEDCFPFLLPKGNRNGEDTTNTKEKADGISNPAN